MHITVTTIPTHCSQLGVVMPKQTHKNNIAQVVTGTEQLNDIDGIWTENTSLTLGVRTADCAPIVLSDRVRVGVVHAGWRGLVSGIIENMLTQFSEAHLEVYLGPHLHTFAVRHDACYDQLQARFGTRFFSEVSGELQFHFTKALQSVLPHGTRIDPRNTATDLHLPSYRHGRNEHRILTTVRFT